MNWLIVPRKLPATDMHGNERFRLTAFRADDGPYGLCSCPNGHPSTLEAMECPEAKEAATKWS